MGSQDVSGASQLKSTATLGASRPRKASEKPARCPFGDMFCVPWERSRCMLCIRRGFGIAPMRTLKPRMADADQLWVRYLATDGMERPFSLQPIVCWTLMLLLIHCTLSGSGAR